MFFKIIQIHKLSTAKLYTLKNNKANIKFSGVVSVAPAPGPLFNFFYIVLKYYFMHNVTFTYSVTMSKA